MSDHQQKGLTVAFTAYREPFFCLFFGLPKNVLTTEIIAEIIAEIIR